MSNNLNAMTDRALCELIGGFVRNQRLENNMTQSEVAMKSGISRSTLSLLEKGDPVTLPTLIQVLRVLDLLHVLDRFVINQMPSPLELAKLDKKKRKRASGKHGEENEQITW
ncbi:helix-turn-helix domain-containing protein [Marinoscillum sp.]|uniref:helix-turn-helix domain-containing protein n=1 Tax=Marinoscillum sp. TaxID=2024838 RepID=UPI003BAB71A2